MKRFDRRDFLQAVGATSTGLGGVALTDRTAGTDTAATEAEATSGCKAPGLPPGIIQVAGGDCGCAPTISITVTGPLYVQRGGSFTCVAPNNDGTTCFEVTLGKRRSMATLRFGGHIQCIETTPGNIDIDIQQRAE